ncbi:hypothetical protein LRS10_03265 [Phenylobacterium sp. J426]|nr:hypothetical protein [Phenylobacterium sp. J426]MCR5873294.1 hypothetical protein [Phenylobacterium sp. J426]
MLLEGLAARLGGGAVQIGGVGQQRRQIQGRLHDAGSALQAGDAQQGLEHGLQPPRLLQSCGGPGGGLGGIGSRRKVLQLGPQAGERRAQLVGDAVGDPADGRHQALDAGEHLIQRGRELIEVIA